MSPVHHVMFRLLEANRDIEDLNVILCLGSGIECDLKLEGRLLRYNHIVSLEIRYDSLFKITMLVVNNGVIEYINPPNAKLSSGYWWNKGDGELDTSEVIRILKG